MTTNQGKHREDLSGFLRRRGSAVARPGSRVGGVSLVEMMIAVSLVTVCALVILGPFRYLALSTQTSKSRTLANNLAQEQVEVLKNKSYYSLLVTTSTYNDTRFSPAISYDNAAYPAESLTEGGIQFYRATRVEYVYQNGSSLSVAPWTGNDTGLKQITVYVLWRDQSGWKYIALQNLMSSPSTSQLNARLSGTITRQGTGAAIAGALVRTIENANYFGTTSASGAYSFSVAADSYTVTVTSTPYFPQTASAAQYVASGGNLTQNFALTKMATQTVSTDVYLLNDLVISQVVASTGPANDEEYIELYNPTASSIPMGSGACCTGSYWAAYASDFYYYDHNGTLNYTYLTYVTTYIAPNSFYLVANGPTVHAGGVTRTADAYYGIPGLSYKGGSSGFNFQNPNHMIESGEAGGIYWWRNSGGWYGADMVGWKKGGSFPTSWTCEGGVAYCVPSASGLVAGDQLIRFSTPGAVVSSLGPSYDSDYNSLDFTFNSPLTVAPSNSGVTKTPVAGYPAAGSWVNLTDSLSQPGLCVNTLVSGLYPVCRYTATAATGTWTAIAYSLGSASSNFYAQFDNIDLTVSSAAFPNAATTPAWPSAGYAHTLLKNTTGYAFVAGYVRNSAGTGLSGITVSGGGSSIPSASGGRYFLAIPAGSVQVTANPNSLSAPTLSASALSLATTAGVLYDSQNFTLLQAGSLRGYFKTTSNVALPNRSVVAMDGVTIAGQATTDSSGNFYIRNIATGTYVVTPALDPLESVSPSSATVTLSAAGTTLFVSTFTISSGLAQITGNVTSGGQPITTGVLVIASSATLSGGASSPAPAVGGTTGCAPCYYGTSSDATGSYTLSLRSSATPYKVYGWYTTFSGNTPTTTRVGPYSVTVSTPSASVTQALSW